MKMSKVTFASLLLIASVPLALAQSNPVPFVNNPLVPASALPGGVGFTLTVNGTGFVSGAVVNWNGSPLATTFLSASQLSAAVAAANIATAGTASVTVASPAPGGGKSNVAYFEVIAPTVTVAYSATEFPAGPVPQAVASGDFNRDGKLDLAIANYANGELTILFGNGDGTFQAPQSYSEGQDAFSLAVGDLNGDGYPDIVVAHWPTFTQEGGVDVWLNNGNGTFANPLDYSSVDYGPPCGLALGDVNGDGHLDLIMGTTGSPTLYTFLGNGDGTLQSPITTSSTYYPVWVTAADFNGDNKLDVAAGTAGYGNTEATVVFFGNGDGTFGPAQQVSSSAGRSLVTADMNGDGFLDLVTSNPNQGTISVLLGNGDGTFQPEVMYPGGYPVVADLNGDGKLDVATLIGSGVSVALGEGNGTLGAPHLFPIAPPGTNTVSQWITTGDFNGDGRMDLATANELYGTSVVLSTTASLQPVGLTFSAQGVGNVRLTNIGGTVLNISDVTIGGNDPQDFSQKNNCPAGLQAAKSCIIRVRFRPTKSGSRSAILSVADDAAGSPQTVPLQGKGK